MKMLPRREFLLSLPRRRVAAGAIIRDQDGRICLVVPNYRPDKLLPGGTIEAGESPAAGTAREVLEELGLDLEIGRLLVVDNITTSEGDDHGGMIFEYDGGVISPEQVAAIVPQAEELLGVVFVHPDELDDHVRPDAAVRIRAGLAALDDGTVAEIRR